MLLNSPLMNPLALPIVVLLVVVFGGAGLALLGRRLVVVGGNISSQSASYRVLWQRYRTWAVIAPIFALAALSGPLALALLAAFVVWQAGREYGLLVGLPDLPRNLMVGSGWLTLLGTLVLGSNCLNWACTVAVLGWAGLAMLPLGPNLNNRFEILLKGLWGYFYTGWLIAHLVAIGMGHIPNLILLIGLGVALSDVGAFCSGKLLGGPKLAPQLSPNKTWGGVLGNVLGATLALLLIGFALPNLQLWQALVLVIAVAIGSVWGDLLESLVKRQSGVKDAGTLLPGFGGLLDRVDSLLVVAPLIYYISITIL